MTAGASAQIESGSGPIHPTRCYISVTTFYIPPNLDAALVELDKMLEAKDKELIRTYRMADEHFGLGMWLRNNWGLWRRSELARWFWKKGISHPDDMSGLILGAYRQHLRGEPFDLSGSVRRIQAAWREQNVRDEAEKRRTDAALQTIRRRMMGLALSPAKPEVVMFPKSPRDDFRVRYAAPFEGGVLFTTREERKKDRPFVNFNVATYFLDGRSRTVRPVATREGDEVEDSVVIGGEAFFNCVNGKGRILRLSGSRRSFIPWPAFAADESVPIRLGFARDASGTPKDLLAVGVRDIARWTGQRWETLPYKDGGLPDCARPVEMKNHQLFFRDERDWMRLHWIDLARPQGRVTFDEHVGVVGSGGPRWENVWDFAFNVDGACWIAAGTGITNQSLLRRSAGGGVYRVALYNDHLRFTGEIFEPGDTWDDPKENGLAVTGIEPTGMGELHVIGPHGLFSIGHGRILRLLRFEGIPKEWIPTTLASLDGGATFVGAVYGGTYLLEPGRDGKTRARPVSPKVGAPRVL